MASRFWAAGGSSSEEESDASEASDVEISQQQQARAASRWAVESDSDSDDDTRVVKSAKDKALDGVDRACTQLKNHMKINDWAQIQTEFDALFKLVDKAKGSIKTSAGHHPKVFVRTMAALEDLMAEKLKNKAEQKKMSKENSKAMIRMKGKLKKQLEPLQRELEAFRAHPESSSSEEESSSESSDDSSDDSDDSSASSASGSSEESDEDASQEEESEDEGSSDEEVRPLLRPVLGTLQQLLTMCLSFHVHSRALMMMTRGRRPSRRRPSRRRTRTCRRARAASSG